MVLVLLTGPEEEHFTKFTLENLWDDVLPVNAYHPPPPPVGLTAVGNDAVKLASHYMS